MPCYVCMYYHYQMHHAENRLNDMEKPRSSDVLWHLPDYLFSLIEDDHLQSSNSSLSQVSKLLPVTI